ncbi:carbohydrate ABC transporter permease [Paenibacillus sp. J5C_2022]|uniref:carbohydrate ABC transporter permease n=1 Tax=Paenibacillus sp. J5C2022 TaxID=2977129 RepID=UPI0021D17467|nr:carbohydrate ABC transporter permease [Paenibacillus sp. J5C2022]MCU6709683.1 carbohydrate ABC transporter permease [Paenibacillus sp. J5C2022]
MRKRAIVENIVQTIIYTALAVLALCCLFPFVYVFCMSIATADEIAQTSIILIPEKVTFKAYQDIWSSGTITQAYRITLFVTIVGTAFNLLFTTVTAYPLAKKMLPGRNLILLYVLFTMLFSGGMIPLYILVKELGLLNSVWSLMVPGLISVFLLVIMKGFFEQLPDGIEESARIDGAGELTLLVRIVLPLSKPIIATLGLFYAVSHWNSYFDAILYIGNPANYPLQVVLRNILIGTRAITEYSPELLEQMNAFSVQMAAVIVATLPILIVYPFVQKHFTKGVLLGSIKG